jgi:hypothetical protein
MTAAFEFLFRRFAMKHPWRALFHDYDILKGRVRLLDPDSLRAAGGVSTAAIIGV